MGRTSILFAAFVAAVLGSGCGIEVAIQSTPNPAAVGQPVEIEITVTNGETCTTESIELCLFPFAELTEAQEELLADIEAVKEEDRQSEFANMAAPAGFPCELDIAMAPLGAIALPANGVDCSEPDGNSPISCDVGSLGPNESVTFSVFVTPTMAGSFSHLVDAMGTVTGSTGCSGTSMDVIVEEIEVTGRPQLAPALSQAGLAVIAILLLKIGFAAMARLRRSAN